jgi:hypothetical protein
MVRALTNSIPWRDTRRLPTTTLHQQLLTPRPSSSTIINLRKSHLHLKRSTYLCPLKCLFSYPQSVPLTVVACFIARPAETDLSVYLSELDACQTVVSCEMYALLLLFFVLITSFFFLSKVRAAFSQTKSPGGWATLLCDYTILSKRAIKYFIHSASANSLTLLQILYLRPKSRSRQTRELMALIGVIGAGGYLARAARYRMGVAVF